MKVAMYYRNNDIRLEELPIPQIAEDEILVKVVASGICGSDIMEWYRLHKAPLVLGHEIAGSIEKIGQKVKDFKEGDRIVAAHHIPCNTCHYCSSGHHTVCETLRTTNFDPGGFAQYVRLPKVNVELGTLKIGEGISYEEATFVEPLACVLRGQRRAQIRKGQTVLVVGSGISGLLHIKLAKLRGVRKVIATDINDYRLERAKKSGADELINASSDVPAKVRELNSGLGADVVIICAGAESALRQALASVERAATVLFFAPTRDEETKIPVPVNELFWRNEITLTSTYAGSPQDHIEAMDLISKKKINVEDMITHRLPLNQTQEGFKLVIEAKESVKVIIEPQRLE